MAPPEAVIIDDRLLIEELLVGLPPARQRVTLHTTAYWYYRACRAAIAGAGGHLSGPFAELPAAEQERAILSLLELRDDVGLPDPRTTVPVMAEVARRHPQLNLLNLEATATAHVLRGTIWLSGQSATGLLPSVLDAEGVSWKTVSVH